MKTLQVHCTGCGERNRMLLRYNVEHYDGSTSSALYCEACAEYAGVDWPGTIKGITCMGCGRMDPCGTHWNDCTLLDGSEVEVLVRP